ncbi:hypothetical protein D3C78_1084020 [compost metagenome]
MLRHAFASALALAADSGDGCLQVGQHFVHARLHAVLPRLHVRQQLRDHLRTVLCGGFAGRAHVLHQSIEALLHGLHGGYRLAKHFVKAVELLAEGALQLAHKGGEYFGKQVLHLPTLITTGRLHGTGDLLQRCFQTVLDSTANLLGEHLARVSVAGGQGIRQLEAFPYLGIHQVLQHLPQIGDQAVLELAGLDRAFIARPHQLRQIFLAYPAIEQAIDGFGQRFQQLVAARQPPLLGQGHRDGGQNRHERAQEGEHDVLEQLIDARIHLLGRARVEMLQTQHQTEEGADNADTGQDAR